ncbi:MAG TPA: hypothetical protein DEQ47_18485 [Solibacterales bacterium]|nr:hypothetical protein [Bryobacterales bacterium]
MNTEETPIDLIRALPAEKQEEILVHAQSLLASNAGNKAPRKSGRGLWADLGIDLTAEDIEGARREMLKNFPRDDF